MPAARKYNVGGRPEDPCLYFDGRVILCLSGATETELDQMRAVATALTKLQASQKKSHAAAMAVAMTWPAWASMRTPEKYAAAHEEMKCGTGGGA